MRILTLLAGSFLAASLVRAEQKALPEEFAVTESIVMQEADELQTSAFVRYASLPDEKTLEWVGAFEYGVTDRLQLECEMPYIFRNPDDEHAVNGIGDMGTSMTPVNQTVFF